MRVAALAERAAFDLDGGRVVIDGHDVAAAIRTPEMDRAATTVARHPGVRRALVARSGPPAPAAGSSWKAGISAPLCSRMPT
jgi:cytidylate kinase